MGAPAIPTIDDSTGMTATSICRPMLRPPRHFFFFATLPVPESGIFCGAPSSLSLIVNCAFCAVVFVGENVTETLQLLPGASDVMHSLVTVNGDGADSPVIITLTVVFFGLPFLIVTVLGLLTASTAVLLPNFTDFGEISSLTSTGVAVAVGVAVLVAVAVAVGVTVAVAVAVAVGGGNAGSWGLNTSTRLFWKSATYTLCFESTATPRGEQIPDVLGAGSPLAPS